MNTRRTSPAAGRNRGGTPEDRRATILEAALRLIATDGVDAITHRRVAAAAGVPLGSTTYYFESREHLLREAFRRYLAQLQAQFAHTGKAFHDAPTVEGLVDHLVETTRRGFEDEALMLAEYELTLFAARDAEVAEALHAWGRTGDLATRAITGEDRRPTTLRCRQDAAAPDSRTRTGQPVTARRRPG
jgi:TetR/AcrR family transcriptional regulator, regulator of biofilm formation and stress response